MHNIEGNNTVQNLHSVKLSQIVMCMQYYIPDLNLSKFPDPTNLFSLCTTLKTILLCKVPVNI